MIHLTLTEQQVDHIANILAQRPFAEVHLLIADIARQASAEVPKAAFIEPRPKANGQDNPPVISTGVAA